MSGYDPDDSYSPYACRTCLAASSELYSIFKNPTEFPELSVAEMLEECASVKISNTDTLPKLICEVCINQTIHCYEFRQQCQQSEFELINNENQKNSDILKHEIYTKIEYLDENCDDLMNKEESIVDSIIIEESCISENEGKTDEKKGSPRLDNEVVIDYVNVNEDTEENGTLVKDELTIVDDYEKLRPIAIIMDESLRTRFKPPPEKVKRTPKSDGNIYECDKCDKQFTLPNYLLQHQKKMHGHDCKICGDNLPTSQQFNQHMSQHRQNNQCLCKYCDQLFPNLDEVIRHTKKIHKHKMLCSYCGNVYKDGHTLMVHMRTHTGEKPHLCKQCGMQFAYASQLMYHIEKHDHEERLLCQICGRVFKRQKDLRNHTYVHTAIARYKCDVCPKEYQTLYNLKKHKRKH